MSSSRSGVAALPPQDSLCFKVIDYFRGHPDEVLTQRDVAKKFSVAPSAVDSMLMPAIQSGHLARAQSDDYGVIFRLPPKRAGFPQPFTPSLTEAVKRNRSRNLFRLDVSAVVIEKEVPVCDAYVRRAPWASIFDKMEIGDSFQLPRAGKASAAYATTAYRKKGHETVRFALRKVSETHVRIWRTA
jgi:hypothetical protein